MSGPSSSLAGARILVPHATGRAALTVIRSLGRAGCVVAASGPSRWCLGGVSRLATTFVVHPDPLGDPRGFAEAVAADARRLGIDAIFPTTDATIDALVAHRAVLPQTARLLVPPPAALDLAHDKVSLMELAASVGVPVPRALATSGSGVEPSRVGEIGFPIVVKPRRSLARDGDRRVKTTVAVVPDAAALARLLEERPFLAEGGYLLQEKVPGEGRGVFLLAKDGAVRGAFAHRRIRETPPWGGVSSLCEAAEPEPSLLAHATRLALALRWSGLLMVEFKWDPASGRGWLMEINGRPWGSMQLAVSCGLDFPSLLCEQELRGDSRPIPPARARVRLWWLAGDASHFASRLRTGGATEIPSMLRDLARTRQGRRLSLDTLQIADPMPFLAEIAGVFSRVVLRRVEP